MNKLELALLESFRKTAGNRFEHPDLQWLEEINKANVLYYRWMFRAASFMHPAVAMELGVCRAEGSAHIAAGADLTIGVDIAPERPVFDENAAKIREHGREYIFIEGPSTAPQTVAKVFEITRERRKLIEFIFIDTIHTYNQAMGEFRTYEPLLAPGALIVMDDVLDPPNEVYRAFQEIPGQHLEMHELHYSDDWRRITVGFGAIVYKSI